MFGNGSNLETLQVIDFGSATISKDKKQNAYFEGIKTSLFYRAPEMAMGLSWNHKVDLWALGCILAELYTGRPLFPPLNEWVLFLFASIIINLDLNASRDKLLFYQELVLGVRFPSHMLDAANLNQARLDEEKNNLIRKYTNLNKLRVSLTLAIISF